MGFSPLGLTDRCRAWLVDAVGPCDVGTPLSGATTATVVPVHAGQRAYVLKWFTWSVFVEEDPARVAHEVHGLELARLARIPAPRVVATDDDGTATGHPALLMTAVAGASLPRPTAWPAEAARAAVRLHELDAASPHQHAPYSPNPLVPEWAHDASVWQEALAVVADLDPTAEAIIHRDLHRWNLHWHQGSLAGVVDWLSACRGPVGEDVGRVWVNEILEGDPDAGTAFRAAYVRIAPWTWDTRWELQSVLDMLPTYESESAVHQWGIPTTRSRLEGCLRVALQRL